MKSPKEAGNAREDTNRRTASDPFSGSVCKLSWRLAWRNSRRTRPKLHTSPAEASARDAPGGRVEEEEKEEMEEEEEEAKEEEEEEGEEEEKEEDEEEEEERNGRCSERKKEC
eukprot:GHVT01089474.1.p2 GENE.GHVT01089474.1~~GHVT01089474.1.p2  ORF type:complete len:113 (-),score=50.59 GHVT01089474.1:56-394(-)